jgi:hypothetical protein
LIWKLYDILHHLYTDHFGVLLACTIIFFALTAGSHWCQRHRALRWIPTVVTGLWELLLVMLKAHTTLVIVVAVIGFSASAFSPWSFFKSTPAAPHLADLSCASTPWACNATSSIVTAITSTTSSDFDDWKREAITSTATALGCHPDTIATVLAIAAPASSAFVQLPPWPELAPPTPDLLLLGAPTEELEEEAYEYYTPQPTDPDDDEGDYAQLQLPAPATTPPPATPSNATTTTLPPPARHHTDILAAFTNFVTTRLNTTTTSLRNATITNTTAAAISQKQARTIGWTTFLCTTVLVLSGVGIG